MHLSIDAHTLPLVQNPALRDYAQTYVRIYQEFMEEVRATGIEIEDGDSSRAATQRIEALAEKGIRIRNAAKSLYVNFISPACEACRTGEGTATFFISLRCHRSCFFCFNPNQENYIYHQEHTRDVASELDQIYARGGHLEHVALTGGEPLLHKEQAVRFFRRAHELFREFTRGFTRAAITRIVQSSRSLPVLTWAKFASVSVCTIPPRAGNTVLTKSPSRANTSLE